MKDHGFSLVELSIVLVILGLLTGGILAGQSLIRASELRAVSTEYARYITASQAFRDKYFQMPGDFRDATRFWLRQSTTAGCTTNSSAAQASTGACDGNGDGNLTVGVAAEYGEFYQFWRHLALAGLIEGTYDGLAGAAHQWQATSTNTPASKLNQGRWQTWNIGAVVSSVLFNYDQGNMLSVSATSASWPSGRIMKPEEAWNIDTKMDDGLPARGKVWAMGWDDCTLAATASDYTQPYDLSNSAVACGLIFNRIF